MSAFVQTASVKVMRSHDYCHFEVVLTLSDTEGNPLTLTAVDNARKEAARLADKAVEQYKIAKRVAQKIETAKGGREWRREEATRIEAIAETDRTTEQKAMLKAYQDACFEANSSYDYEDDYQDDD